MEVGLGAFNLIFWEERKGEGRGGEGREGESNVLEMVKEN